MSSSQVIVAGPRNGITIQKIEQEIKKSPLNVLTSAKSYSGKSNIVIEGLDFRKLNKSGEKQCNVTNCQNVTIRRCIFGNKSTLGVALNITGEKTRKVTVEYCIFEDMTYTESNGGEPLRIGNSQFSGCNLECTVRNCIFRNLNSDPETISIKSNKNIIEDNFFINNKSNVTVRHGGLTTIRHNYFKGRGGIRIHGYGNYVGYNCFEDNKETDSFAPIIVRNGNKDKDPNWTTQDKPSEKAGSSHAIYAQTVNLKVENNEFKNCKKTVIELAKGASLKPKNTTNTNNKTVSKFSFESGSTAPTPPQPTPPTPEPVPPEPIPPVPEPIPEPVPEPTPTPEPVPEPVDPEEEQPVVTPQPDEVNETRMCGIFRHEEAKVHLHIYACAEHAAILREKFKQILRETEEEARILEEQEEDRGLLDKAVEKVKDVFPE